MLNTEEAWLLITIVVMLMGFAIGLAVGEKVTTRRLTVVFDAETLRLLSKLSNGYDKDELLHLLRVLEQQKDRRDEAMERFSDVVDMTFEFFSKRDVQYDVEGSLEKLTQHFEEQERQTRYRPVALPIFNDFSQIENVKYYQYLIALSKSVSVNCELRYYECTDRWAIKIEANDFFDNKEFDKDILSSVLTSAIDYVRALT